jgi:hypothetical protein
MRRRARIYREVRPHRTGAVNVSDRAPGGAGSQGWNFVLGRLFWGVRVTEHTTNMRAKEEAGCDHECVLEI